MTNLPIAPREVLEVYLDALVAGDLEAMANSFAEDATWKLRGGLPLSGTKRGRAEIMEFLTGAGSLYEPGTQSFTFSSITAEEDRAVVEWRVQAVATATGREYDNEYRGVFVVRDGQIVEVREYLDSAYAGEVLFGEPAPTS